jgi:hypothetical protein
MPKIKDPGQELAEKIQERLLREHLINAANKDFISKLAEGKLKENDWQSILLDRIHSKK